PEPTGFLLIGPPAPAGVRVGSRQHKGCDLVPSCVLTILLENSPGGGAGAAGPRDVSFFAWFGRLCRPNQAQIQTLLGGLCPPNLHLSKPAVSLIDCFILEPRLEGLTAQSQSQAGRR